MNRQLFSYWSGPVSWLERLSVASAQALGHELTVFSYEPAALKNTGLGCRIDDARQIFCDPGIDGLRGALPDHFSDHFRVEGLNAGGGIWIDLDIILTKAFPADDYLIAREDEKSICGAVLYAPADSPLLAEYLEICRHRPVSYIPPWWSRTRRARYRWKQFRSRITGRKPPKGPNGDRLPYGPPALTYLTRKHGVRVLEAEAFYPVHWRDAARLVAPDADIDSMVTNAITVHAWHGMLRRNGLTAQPHPRSWLGRKCIEYGCA